MAGALLSEQILSPGRDRLAAEEGIGLLKRLFGQHGEHPIDAPLSELERLRAVPLIFGLLPSVALTRRSSLEKVKPAIRTHLGLLGLGIDEELVDILKRIADQLVLTCLDSQYRPTKKSISALRASDPQTYLALRMRQNDRCGVCGRHFDQTDAIHLDHVLPWRIGGESEANYQLLCAECNQGKREFVSALQSPYFLNWYYLTAPLPVERPTLEVRYATFAIHRTCHCGAAPTAGQLHLVKDIASGMALVDNLRVACDRHRLDRR